MMSLRLKPVHFLFCISFIYLVYTPFMQAGNRAYRLGNFRLLKVARHKLLQSTQRREVAQSFRTGGVGAYIPHKPLRGGPAEYFNSFKHNPEGRIAIYHNWKLRFKIFVHNPINDVISYTILRYRSWEPELGRALVQRHEALENGSILSFLDIGSNIGTHALELASQGVDVVSIEPLLFNAELQLASASLNRYHDSFILVNAAVSNVSKGHVCIFSAEDQHHAFNAGNGQIHEGTSNCDLSNNVLPHERVPVSTVDEIMVGHPLLSGKCFGTVKCDIEGFELLALRGAKKTLFENPHCEKPCTVHFEYTQDFLKITNLKPGEIHEFLHAYGYKFYTAAFWIKVDITKAASTDGDYFAILDEPRCLREFREFIPPTNQTQS
mmetsp:Transcript_2836/g.4090  ORF Transcript_2836/g.4090 Transcript_2836/m.4090 type:complete len:380 (-) Transcript_2836:279-1418(-)